MKYAERFVSPPTAPGNLCLYRRASSGDARFSARCERKGGFPTTNVECRRCGRALERGNTRLRFREEITSVDLKVRYLALEPCERASKRLPGEGDGTGIDIQADQVSRECLDLSIRPPAGEPTSERAEESCGSTSGLQDPRHLRSIPVAAHLVTKDVDDRARCIVNPERTAHL